MDCPGSCPLQWTLIGVVDERADENRPDGLNRWPDRQLGLLRRLRSDSECRRLSNLSLWSGLMMNGAFLKLSTIGTYEVWKEGKCSQNTRAVSFKSWLFSSGSLKSFAVCIYMRFSSFFLQKPNDFMSLRIYSLLQVTSFHQVRSAALQILIPHNSPSDAADKINVRGEYCGHGRRHYQSDLDCAATVTIPGYRRHRR